MTSQSKSYEGGCSCGHVRYRVQSEPLIVHNCNCRGCQRQTGASFALNALYEAERVELLQGRVEEIRVPTPSGEGQLIARCPECKVAIWSNYNMGGLKERIRFIRVGSLDDPDRLPPDVFIYTDSKQPWVTLPADAPAFDEFYNIGRVWSRDSLKRLKAIKAAAALEDA